MAGTYTKRMGRARLAALAGLLGTLAALGGCLPQRFVIDVTPAKRELQESEVMTTGVGAANAKVALIPVTGLIADVTAPGLLGPGSNMVDDFAARLRRAEEDPNVRAVVLRINTPGGTVTGSDIILSEIRRFRERTGKPVVASMGEIATSGGYYIACGADEMMAQPTSVTGSIGVIFQTVNVSRGLAMIGVEARAVKSGANKDVANPLTPIDESQYEVLESMVDSYYDRFRTLVVERRGGLSPADVEWATDGRVMTGERALEVGLVDSLGGVREAVDAARRLAGVQGSVRVVAYHPGGIGPRSPYGVIGSDGAPEMARGGGEVNVLNIPLPESLAIEPGFYYLWRP
ncbi:MAG: signal peptide peptidase SppA [Planctomycetota bacterium]|nr:signal peptide peptidase SppA [Planctomycetota bacterium]